MRLRSFVPVLAPKHRAGSRFEPGHNMRCRVFDGKWKDARYDRDAQSFTVAAHGGAIETRAVKLWAHAPPRDCSDPVVEVWVGVTGGRD